MLVTSRYSFDGATHAQHVTRTTKYVIKSCVHARRTDARLLGWPARKIASLSTRRRKIPISLSTTSRTVGFFQIASYRIAWKHTVRSFVVRVQQNLPVILMWSMKVDQKMRTLTNPLKSHFIDRSYCLFVSFCLPLCIDKRNYPREQKCPIIITWLRDTSNENYIML